MEPENNKKSLESEILAKIRSGRLKMKPKWRFLLRAGLFAVAGIAALLASLYLLSFVIFMLRRTGIWFVPIFGFPGWFTFLASFPWLVIIFALLMVFVLEMLITRYSFAYRRPLVYSLLSLILVVVVGGFVIARWTPFHRRVAGFALERHVPFARNFYRDFGAPPLRDVHRGEITTTTPNGFIIQDPREGMLNVIITPRTRLPLGMDFGIGKMAVVFGPEQSSTIQAFGVRIIDDED